MRCPLCAHRVSYRGVACRRCWHALPNAHTAQLAAAARTCQVRPWLDALDAAKNWLNQNRKAA